MTKMTRIFGHHIGGLVPEAARGHISLLWAWLLSIREMLLLLLTHELIHRIWDGIVFEKVLEQIHNANSRVTLMTITGREQFANHLKSLEVYKISWNFGTLTLYLTLQYIASSYTGNSLSHTSTKIEQINRHKLNTKYWNIIPARVRMCEDHWEIYRLCDRDHSKHIRMDPIVRVRDELGDKYKWYLVPGNSRTLLWTISIVGISISPLIIVIGDIAQAVEERLN